MTDNHPSQPAPDPAAAERSPDEPSATSSGSLVLGERAAANLIRTATASGDTVFDLDYDPTLRAAALAGGRSHRSVDLADLGGPPERHADLIVLCWPRPGDPSWLTSAGEVLAAVSWLLAPTGHVAVLLDPTQALAYGITWTGSLLAAASNAGLPVLEDVICIHNLDADAPASQLTARVTLRHRIVLVLGTAKARHARH